MDKILLINACVRGDRSRTLRLARELAARLRGEVTELDLAAEGVTYLTDETLRQRDKLIARGDYSAPMFRFARALKECGQLVVAAPYWDMGCPAVLKCWIEQICVNGLTFRYGENGVPIGLCGAAKMWYVMTSGGYVTEAANMGYANLAALCTGMFGIRETQCVSAEGLDIVGSDPEAILRRAIDALPNG